MAGGCTDGGEGFAIRQHDKSRLRLTMPPIRPRASSRRRRYTADKSGTLVFRRFLPRCAGAFVCVLLPTSFSGVLDTKRTMFYCGQILEKSTGPKLSPSSFGRGTANCRVGICVFVSNVAFPQCFIYFMSWKPNRNAVRCQVKIVKQHIIVSNNVLCRGLPCYMPG